MRPCVAGTLAGLAFATLAPAACAQDGADPGSYIARIEAPRIPGDPGLAGKTMAELLAAANVPGVSVAVIRDFRIHWAKGYGLASVAEGRAVDTSTLFQAASISKPVTAMAVLKLAQDGAVDLDRDVNVYLRSWQVPDSEHTRTQKVTLRALLSHTSGSDDGFGFPGYKPDAARPTLVQILNGERPSNVGPVRFARAPYTAQKYSGGGTTIVQLLLEDVTRRDFADLMRETVLAPVGMTGSGFGQPIPAALAGRAAHAHDRTGAAMGAAWHVYPEQAAAGLWTSPSDLARWVIEVQRAVQGEGRVLTAASAREMLAPVGVGPFGVGLTFEKFGEGWYFSHGGSNWGFRANFWGHFRKGYGVVVMTNGDGGQAAILELRERVGRAYGWDAFDAPLRR